MPEIKRVSVNAIVDNGLLTGDEISRLFPNCSVKVIPYRKKDGGRHTMYDVLVQMGIYRSIEAARKAWTKTGDAVPGGLNTYLKFSKTRVTEITIYMPSTDVESVHV